MRNTELYCHTVSFQDLKAFPPWFRTAEPCREEIIISNIWVLTVIHLYKHKETCFAIEVDHDDSIFPSFRASLYRIVSPKSHARHVSHI